MRIVIDAVAVAAELVRHRAPVDQSSRDSFFLDSRVNPEPPWSVQADPELLR
jgi:hypothetical protein